MFEREVTVETKGQDRCGRTIGEVLLLDGRNLNREVVKTGFAWWFRRYAAGDETIEPLERESRDAKNGLWLDSEPVPECGCEKLHPQVMSDLRVGISLTRGLLSGSPMVSEYVR